VSGIGAFRVLILHDIFRAVFTASSFLVLLLAWYFYSLPHPALRWQDQRPFPQLFHRLLGEDGRRILRRFTLIDREHLRQQLMEATAPFGGWDDDAEAAFDEAFDRFEALLPNERDVSNALSHFERMKVISRPTARDLIVSPKALAQTHPALATQMQEFLTAASTNDNARVFGQDIAKAMEPVPRKRRRDQTRKEKHILDRQELLLHRERAEAAEERARTTELENADLRALLALYEGESAEPAKFTTQAKEA
jgi:hypothetical protein